MSISPAWMVVRQADKSGALLCFALSSEIEAGDVLAPLVRMLGADGADLLLRRIGMLKALAASLVAWAALQSVKPFTWARVVAADRCGTFVRLGLVDGRRAVPFLNGLVGGEHDAADAYDLLTRLGLRPPVALRVLALLAVRAAAAAVPAIPVRDAAFAVAQLVAIAASADVAEADRARLRLLDVNGTGSCSLLAAFCAAMNRGSVDVKAAARSLQLQSLKDSEQVKAQLRAAFQSLTSPDEFPDEYARLNSAGGEQYVDGGIAAVLGARWYAHVADSAAPPPFVVVTLNTGYRATHAQVFSALMVILQAGVDAASLDAFVRQLPCDYLGDNSADYVMQVIDDVHASGATVDRPACLRNAVRCLLDTPATAPLFLIVVSIPAPSNDKLPFQHTYALVSEHEHAHHWPESVVESVWHGDHPVAL